MAGTEHEAETAASQAWETLQLLWRVDHALAILSKGMLKVLGVTGPQRMILGIVGRRPGVTAGAISEAARIHPSTLSGILDRLERGQYLVRSKDSADGRRACFELLPGGRTIVDARRGTVEAAVVRSLAPLSPEDRATIRRWLQAFGDELQRERKGLDDG